ncbi:MAG: ATP-binding protein, partial [Bdellovibrionaceae bacterium]|nr:ATP-binding protein [Pseudobdellovibrionaceae bacterium]
DLGLPDSSMDKTLSRVLGVAKGIPIVVLSSLDDEEFGMNVVHQGAQNFICKNWMDGELLFRSLRYAIERNSVEEELRKANRIKDDFLATLSHELRTPINVIQGFSEMLQDERLPNQEKNQAIEAIVRNAKLQVSLINDMLDMSRIITGKLILQCVTQDLVPIINDVIESVNLAAKSKRIDLTKKYNFQTVSINGDPVRLHQIFWNILSNAIKFSPVGGKIEVRLKSNKTNIEIEVEDWGEGIDPKFLPFVFDRFSQQDTSIRRHYGGLGLGLSIVKYLVELHGGKIEGKSEGVGKGSTFLVTFPVLIDDVSVEKISNYEKLIEFKQVDKKENQDDKIREVLTIKDLHVLVIDDSVDSLILTKTLLQKNGAKVTTANSSAQALKLLTEITPNVIVCDIGMPDEDGYTFLRKLRERENQQKVKNIPATALTAYTREEEKNEAYRVGFQSHLSKPVDQNALVKVIYSLSHAES